MVKIMPSPYREGLDTFGCKFQGKDSHIQTLPQIRKIRNIPKPS